MRYSFNDIYYDTPPPPVSDKYLGDSRIDGGKIYRNEIGFMYKINYHLGERFRYNIVQDFEIPSIKNEIPSLDEFINRKE